uniref:ARID domain-containing protein n=1 Tax=Bursaphelenchus xylophilus TaxID=6326 RepID=A0A1I7SC37_BURXY
MSNENADSVKDFFQSLDKATHSPSPAPQVEQPSPSVGSTSPHEENDQHNSTDDSTNTNNSVENIFQKIGAIPPRLHPELGMHNAFPFGNMNAFLEVIKQNSGSGDSMNFDFGPLMNQASSSLDIDRNSSNPSANEPEDLSLERGKQENDDNHLSNASNWTFEEQFKQLYELSDDKKRKEWLDDWFMFMHKKGKSVTRIPIMAKQVLDLYELYRLVVQHGGLVEIINKKLWREITKGLNLPSSITSAAFTLRTQYQKYLYDYECEKEGLSSPSDLHAAIEGNKREGRRNNGGSSNGNGSFRGTSGPPGFPYPLVPHSAAAAAMSSLFSKHLNSLMGQDDHSSHNTQMMNAVNNAYGLDTNNRQMDILQRFAEAMQSKNPAANGLSGRDSTCSGDSEPVAKKLKTSSPLRLKSESPGPKNSLDQILKNSHSTALKVSSSTMPNGEKSMVVSMEINGTTYQGVLFPASSSDSHPNGDALTELFGHKTNGKEWNDS